MSQKLPPIGQEIKDARTRCCTFTELRTRAYEKADTGQFEDWKEIGSVIENEDCPGAVRRLGFDPILKDMLNARCRQARHKES